MEIGSPRLVPFEIQSYAIITSPTSRHTFFNLVSPLRGQFQLRMQIFWQQLHAHIRFLSRASKRIEIQISIKLEPTTQITLESTSFVLAFWSKKALDISSVLSRGCLQVYEVCVCTTPLSANTHSSPQIVCYTKC